MEVKARTVRARQLRAESQPGEHRLWAALRGRALGGFKFRRQHPINRFVADFACVEARVVVELDGSHHADQQEADEARTEVLRSCGWLVMRFDNAALDDVFGFDHVLADILASCRTGRCCPLPPGEVFRVKWVALGA